MPRPKIKDKYNSAMVVMLRPELHKKLKNHAIKYDNGIVSVTVRQAVTEYLENFNN
jgi:hypothetical protein